MKKTKRVREVYKIGVDTEDYIHSSYTNMKNIFEENVITTKNSYDEALSSVRKVMVYILDDIIQYWKALRSEFIKKGISVGLTDKEDPSAFLEAYNQRFQEVIGGKITGDMLKLKNYTIEYKGVKSSTAKSASAIQKNQEKQQKIINDSWETLIEFMFEALKFYDQQNKLWETAFTGESEKDFKKRVKGAMPINRIEKEIKNALSKIGISPNNAIKFLTDIKNKKIALSAKKMEELFEASYENQYASASGLLIEYSALVELKEDEIFRKLLGGEDYDIRHQTGKQLQDISVGDLIVSNLSYEKKEVKDLKILSSFKLTDSISVERPYVVTADILDTALFINNRNLQIDKGTYEKIKWIRQNLISLSVFSTEGGEPNLEDFYRYETEMALLLQIPRILDGVYSYQAEILGPVLNNGSEAIIHTALFFTKGTFFWMVDILENIKSLIIEDNLKKGIVFTERKTIIQESPVTATDLENLYKEKREAIKSLSKHKVNYKTISDNIDLESINNKFKDWKPIKSILSTVKYGNLINK